MKFLKEVTCSKCGGTGHCQEVDFVELRKIREAAGISLRELAKQLGFTAAYLSDIERGRRNCTNRPLQAYQRLALAVKVSGPVK